MMDSTQKPILIAGAGLASLLFAQALLRASIPFVIYERDSSLSFRAQGYRLRLSREGLDAIESVLEPQAFQRFWDTCSKTGGGGFANLNALSGEIIPKEDRPAVDQGKGPSEDGNTKKPDQNLSSRDGKIVGISRGDMRRLFMTGCEPYVRWSHHVSAYELTTTGVCVLFADGSRSVEGALLVAGDGLSSRIARQVSGGRLRVFDTGARGIHGQAPSAAFGGLDEGVWMMLDTSRGKGARVGVITNVRPGDRYDPAAHLGWTMTAPPGVISAPNDDLAVIGTPAADIAKGLTTDWHPRLRPLFSDMDTGDAAFWKITCSTPTGVPDWPNAARVTVLGDAAHSMTPAGGIGANTAVRDSALLGRLLAQAGGYWEGVTAAYEREKRVYASEEVRTSYCFAT